MNASPGGVDNVDDDIDMGTRALPRVVLDVDACINRHRFNATSVLHMHAVKPFFDHIPSTRRRRAYIAISKHERIRPSTYLEPRGTSILFAAQALCTGMQGIIGLPAAHHTHLSSPPISTCRKYRSCRASCAFGLIATSASRPSLPLLLLLPLLLFLSLP